MAVPSLVRVWVEAAVSLPPAMLGAALGVDAVSGAPLARHSGSTVLERLPPGIGSMNGTTTTAAEDGRGRVVGGIFRNAATTATAAASSFPSSTDIANALGDAVLEAGLQQLNNSHLLLLTATLMDERNRSGSGGGNSSSSSMIAPVRRLRSRARCCCSCNPVLRHPIQKSSVRPLTVPPSSAWAPCCEGWARHRACLRRAGRRRGTRCRHSRRGTRRWRRKAHCSSARWHIAGNFYTYCIHTYA